MVALSLNLASLVGVLLFIWAIPAGIMGLFQIFFVLQRRADTSPAVIGKTILLVVQSLGRMLMLPFSGYILFFQGWRLDPVLQLMTLALGIGIIFESFSSVASDYKTWRMRTGRAIPTIAVQSQPSDNVK
jgi:hypothetical protein